MTQFRAAFHETRFLRCLDDTKEYRAECSCGWRTRGTLEECQTLAATHDLNEPLEFASGLSDLKPGE